ncbi:CPBP family intramembrane glutamic endopeptidase [Pseudooceanicola nanhaiensis]|uniref:CPBP family intramembrane glutamic endopeptidase n=1 Tax=Pseudooceanicola nanhaiensis TaxID=375761 RepID=UPI001CD4E028|nr:CPBP family intramembrane glutamic endopeptidase [Pseudooceanicola nanhaiensis]MCA0921787.1 CPBP family intramembrane metalloprotease [Pseudooceanicola nanhaiensis]
MSYAAQAQFSEPAHRRPALWRLVLGALLVAGLYMGLMAGWFFAQTQWGLPMKFDSEGRTATGLTLLLWSFLCLLVAIAIVVPLLHRRSPWSLLGPRDRFLRGFLRTFVAALIVGIPLALLPMPGGLTPEPNVPLDRWLRLMPLALTGIFIQILAEEVMFRGYLQSQLAARFRSPLIWMVLPAVIFGLLHLNPTEDAGTMLLLIASPTLFGLIAADLTARDGSLGPAVALHFLNNVSALTILSLEGPMSGLSLYTLPITAGDPALRLQIPIELASLVLLWGVARLAIRRR